MSETEVTPKKQRTGLCKKHPYYKAIRRPKDCCESCIAAWNANHPNQAQILIPGMLTYIDVELPSKYQRLRALATRLRNCLSSVGWLMKKPLPITKIEKSDLEPPGGWPR